MGYFDRKYGRVFCCIPTKLGVVILALCLLVGALLEISLYFVFAFETEGKLSKSPVTSVGSPVFGGDSPHGDLGSCKGAAWWSLWVRKIFELTGAVYAGLWGFLGVRDHCGPLVNKIYQYLVLLALLRLLLLVLDVAFIKICDNYPDNVMRLLVFWGRRTITNGKCSSVRIRFQFCS